MAQEWTENNENYFLRETSTRMPILPLGVYSLELSIAGHYLKRIEDEFVFAHKIYGLESKLIDRVVKTHSEINRNLGVLLNGMKGTGKTVTSKILCNKLQQPVIIVSQNTSGCHTYLNSIPQNITIFIDEYEKIFEKDADMLTIMDGALNSEFKRVFILTTNTLYINENLLQRPGRIRYRKTFKDLTPVVLEEIVDDLLMDKSLKPETIRFLSTLEIITVDIVKAVIEEVNIHGEGPDSFKDVFNVNKLTGKYDLIQITEDEEEIVPFKRNVSINIREFEDAESYVGYNFTADHEELGKIVKIVDNKTFIIKPKGRGKEKLTLKIQPADLVNRSYRWTSTSLS